ncbi:hypothetical protein [Helicobacter sp. 23-1045]
MSVFVDLRFLNLHLGASFADLVNRHKARTASPLSLCRFIKNHKISTATASIAIRAIRQVSANLNFPLPCGGGQGGG